MKSIFQKIISALSVVLLLTLGACEIDLVTDPNNPSLGSALNDAKKPELQVLVTGLEARHRGYVQNAVEMFGVFGREVWAYFGSDPRFANEWLGLSIAQTYPDFFSSGGTYVNPYLAVKQANVLIKAAQNSTALTDAERKGYIGFAKTIKGFQLLWPLMQQYENGIRIDVEDPLNPGPTLPFDQAIRAIGVILNEGHTDLLAAGSTFSFNLTSGFAGFNTPDKMAQVNRAIAARAALYAKDYSGALNNLNGSFMDLNVTDVTADKMDIGPAHPFGISPDALNPLYYPIDLPTSTILICHPDWVEDALPGDRRLSKVARRTNNPAQNPAIRDAGGNLLLGEYQDARWTSNTLPFKFIRNEELILIYAEASLLTNNTANAVSAINTIRNTWGIGNYTGTTTQDALLNEILFQRRYSLWAEGGHRWIDLRRTNRLNNTYVDLRDRGNIFTQVARRTSEINWDAR